MHTRATRKGYSLTRIIGKIYPTGRKKLFGKATKKSDKEFSIIPYHSACPCEYPCVATFAPKKAVAGSIAVLLIILKQAVAHRTSAVVAKKRQAINTRNPYNAGCRGLSGIE